MDREPMVDVIDVNGVHWYWSTWCRHGLCSRCRATEIAPGVARKPAQCKVCAAPCGCECHAWEHLPWA
jgi:hypothetical protein